MEDESGYEGQSIHGIGDDFQCAFRFKKGNGAVGVQDKAEPEAQCQKRQNNGRCKKGMERKILFHFFNHETDLSSEGY